MGSGLPGILLANCKFHKQRTLVTLLQSYINKIFYLPWSEWESARTENKIKGTIKNPARITLIDFWTIVSWEGTQNFEEKMEEKQKNPEFCEGSTAGSV